MGVACALLAMVTSCLFTFLVYPLIAGRYGLALDPDGHGALGMAIWKLHTFSYFPSALPTITRGPLYPFLIAVLLDASGGWWPGCVQAAQCVFFGLTCLITYEIGLRLWNRKVGAIAAAICAMHPFLFWYTSRIWIEDLSMLLFGGMILAVLVFDQRPSTGRAISLGIIIGLACLCKGTFLPFVIAVPVFLYFRRGSRISRPLLAAVMACSLVVIAPWTVRNWKLTGSFIPVHGHMGFNIRVGDIFIEHIRESPLNVTPLWKHSSKEAARMLDVRPGEDFGGWANEIAVNSAMTANSLHLYAGQPWFVVEKVLLNAVLFWVWSETTAKTLVLAILQLPVLILCAVAIARMLRSGELFGSRGIPIYCMALFYAVHLPVLALGRYSVVLIPAMLVYAAAVLTLGRAAPEQEQRAARVTSLTTAAAAAGGDRS